MAALHNVSETIKHLPEPTFSPSLGESHSSTSGVHRRVEKVKQSESQRSGGTDPQDSPLPSKEIPGGSRIGIGSLPGRLSEVSVAKLPEERRQENLPSHETDHEILGKTGGVGPLPGGPNESGVALLPEERAHPADESWSKSKDAKALSSEGIVSDKPGIEPKSTVTDESQVAQVGAQNGHDDRPGERGAPAAHWHAQGVNEPSDQTQHSNSPHVHPGLGPRSDSGAQGRTVSQPNTTTQGSTETEGEYVEKIAGSEEACTTTSTSSPSDVQHASAISEHPAPDTQTVPVTAGRKHRASTGSSPTHEVGFMDRMKGKAKIITGKLKHEKKVEQGK